MGVLGGRGTRGMVGYTSDQAQLRQTRLDRFLYRTPDITRKTVGQDFPLREHSAQKHG